jgi:transposase
VTPVVSAIKPPAKTPSACALRYAVNARLATDSEVPKALVSATTEKLLMPLPPYSPDMNPIEMAFAKLKTLLRQVPERTRDGLWQRIGALLDRFTPEECDNYLRAAG